MTVMSNPYQCDHMTMEIASLKAVIDSFPVFLIQRERLPGGGEQSAAVQTEQWSADEQSCFIAVGQNITRGEKVREGETFPFLCNPVGIPLAPSLDRNLQWVF